jgi:hypothetical protein
MKLCVKIAATAFVLMLVSLGLTSYAHGSPYQDWEPLLRLSVYVLLGIGAVWSLFAIIAAIWEIK